MIKLFMVLLRASQRTVLLAVLAGFVGGASTAGLIALINSVLNNSVLPGLDARWLYAALVLVVLCCNFLSRILLIGLVNTSITRLQIHLSRSFLTAPLAELERIGAPRLLAAITDDAVTIGNALLSFANLSISIAAAVVCLLYLGWISWIVLLAATCFVILGVATYYGLESRARAALWRASDSRDAFFRQLRALTEGVKELKLHAGRRFAFLSRMLEPTAALFRQHQVEGLRQYAAAESWSQLILFVSIGLLLFVVPLLTIMDSATLSSSTLVFFYLMEPLTVIMFSMPNLGQASVALQKVQQLGVSLSIDARLDPAPERSANAGAWQEVTLRQVSYTYYREREDSHFALGPLDVSFRPGELTFLIGGNGSGKTTLAKLLTGLYIPEHGEIYLDQQRITDANREDYRRLFSAIFSDFYLFETLLGLNVSELDSRAREYLKQLHLDHKVAITDGALSTTALSQGQRKRLALLTAYLEDRSFYVFDEWAADQDPIFREIFYTQLLPELKRKDKAVVVITHDDRYFQIADQVLRLDYGQLVPGAVSMSKV